MGISNQAPSSFFAGDSVRWVQTSAAYPFADGWKIRAEIVGVSNHYTTDSVDDGAGEHLVSFAAAETASMVAGEYQLVLAAIKGSERFTLSAQPIQIHADPSAAADHRSKVKQALDTVNDYLLNSSNISAASYSIAGRTLARHSMTELLALRKQLQRDYQAELQLARIAAGKNPRRRLLTRMRG